MKYNGLTINGVTKSASFAYNQDGSLSQSVDFGNSTVNYSYNNAGAPVSATDYAGFKWVSAGAYTAGGLLTKMVQGNSSTYAGITTSNIFSKRLQPAVLSAATPSATVLSLSYGFGSAGSNNGNIQQIVNNMDNTRSQIFSYDQLNRLASAQEGTKWGDNYQYDAWGNLTQKTQIAGTSAGENLSVTVNPTNQVAGLGYDAAGNVTTDNLANHWTYDAEGRALTVAGDTYTYDGDGVRVAKSGTNAALYWPAGGTVLTKTDLSGNTPDHYVYFDGQLAVWLHSNLSTHYFLRDHLGSLRETVSPAGAVQDNLDYYPWGAQAHGSITSGTTYTFTGDESDTESSSLNTEFRQLSPTLGRWLRPDPYDGSYDATNPQSLNRYSYVGNNPLNLIDPSGTVDDDPASQDPVYFGELGPTVTVPTTFDTFDPGLFPFLSFANGGYGAYYGIPGIGVGRVPLNTRVPKSQATCIANALMANVPGVQSVTPTPNGPTFDNGGHENDTFNLSFSSPAAMTQFLAATGRTSLIPGSVSEYGYGPGQRLSGGLHATFYGFPNGQLAVTSHLDSFDPNDGLGPLLGHLFVDLIRGHIGHPRLDKGC